MQIQETFEEPGGSSDGVGGVGEASWLELVFRQVPGGIWATDSDLRIVWAIGRLRGTNKPLAELCGTSVHEYLASGDPNEPAIEACRAALRGEHTKLLARQGERCYDIAIEPLYGRGGVVLGTLGIAVDVSDHERAANKQQHALSLLKATLNSTADGLLVVDREGKIAAFNERFLELWRIPVELAESGDDQRLIEAVLEQLSDSDRFSRRVQELYSEPEEESLDVLRFRDGRVYERLSRPQRLAGDVVGRVWSFRDVSEREATLVRMQLLADAGRLLGTLEPERALDSVARLAVHRFAEAAAIDVLANGGPHRVILVPKEGPHCEELAELPPSVLAGRSSLWSRGNYTRITVPVAARGHLLAALSFLVRRPRSYSSADVATAEELAARCALALEHARLYREARGALAARDEMLAVVAHEIRGPLTSMRLAAETLKRRASPPLDPRVLGLLERENARLARFVDELLDAVRFHAGRVRFDLEDVDLAEVLRFVCSRMTPEIELSGSTLSVTTEGANVGAWDRARLDQVVTNLLSNALKYGEGGPIRITLASRDDVSMLVVEDHGIGIAPEEQRSIFDPFERAGASHTFGGLGLGLYIVRTILEGLGGSISVDSELGRGSRFVVTLPQRRAST